MKALTVRQPWAWAIIAGGKNIENRTIRWQYRGPLAIHTAAKLDHHGRTDPYVLQAWNHRMTGYPLDVPHLRLGAVIGVVDLVGAHDGYSGCCQPWGMDRAAPSGYGYVHLELANPRPLAKPVPWKGRLGLWELPDEVCSGVTTEHRGGTS